MNEKLKIWARATAVRCLRTFCVTVIGLFPSGTLITQVDWRFVLVSAVSSTFLIFLMCVVSGLPEVDLMTEDVPDEIEAEEEDENIEQRDSAD